MQWSALAEVHGFAYCELPLSW